MISDREIIERGVEQLLADGKLDDPHLVMHILRCVQRMPDRMRQAVTLRHVYAMGHVQISERLGITEADVGCLLGEAAQRLRCELWPVTLAERIQRALRRAFK